VPGIITGRGGAGKTTCVNIASNIGVYFTQWEKIPTVIIDGDLFLPKLAFHFGIYNPKV
jgi:septum site-determining protein MinD